MQKKKKVSLLNKDELPRIIYPVKMWYYENTELGDLGKAPYKVFNDRFYYHFYRKRDTDFVRDVLTRQRDEMRSLYDERQEIKDIIRETPNLPTVKRERIKREPRDRFAKTPKELKELSIPVPPPTVKEDIFRSALFPVEEKTAEKKVKVYTRPIY